jgi:hypothetical protein
MREVKPKRRALYEHLNGQITTRTRPSGGYIIEVLVPSRKERLNALACIFAVESLLRSMKGVLVKGQSYAENHALGIAASRELLVVALGALDKPS